jgi:hypothetical protein
VLPLESAAEDNPCDPLTQFANKTTRPLDIPDDNVMTVVPALDDSENLWTSET